MKRFWRRLWRGDPEAVERARQANVHASLQWARARRSERAAVQLMLHNHLTERFLRDMQRRGAQ
jgi:hypothetical protein